MVWPLLNAKLLNFSDDFCASLVAVPFLYLIDVLANHVQQHPLISQYCFVAGYLLDKVSVFFGKFFYLQTR